MRLETLAVHAGRRVDPTTGAVTPAIHPSTTFEREPDGSYPRGFLYTRNANPNRNALEECLAALEGGEAAAAFASGSAATSAVFLALQPGDHVVAPTDAYHGTSRLLRETFSRWGLEATFPDTRPLRARAPGGELPGAPRARGDGPLPRVARAPRPRHRPAPDGRVRRHGVGGGAGRPRSRAGRGGQGARLHARDELRRDGEPRRAPRLDRRDRDHHPRDPAAPQHRARERRRPDRGPRSGARVRRRDPMTLQGRAALVTGAARGIGLAIASRFVAEGARVALVDVDPGVEGAATRLGEQALGLIADGTATAAVERGVASVHQRWGRLDVVVNNAGITGGSRLTWEVSDEEWQRVLAVDLTSVFLVSRAAVRIMLGQGSGRIVNIASIAGKEGNPTLVPYSTAKAGVIGFTKALAKEVATRGILVNAVAPAVIGTDMVRQMSRETVDMLVAKIPMGRIGRPEEVAALVTWLASDECSFSTGAVYDLSGGRATY